MLRSLNQLRGYVLSANDSEIGCCVDFLMEDNLWVVRYMVADTKKWLPNRKVLISPLSLGEPDWKWLRLPINLTLQQIKDAPPLDDDAPVSRRYERQWFRYYGWPYYWIGPELWGSTPNPVLVGKQQEIEKATETEETEETEEDHANHYVLLSAREVIGYRISAVDGKMGEVDDFIVDDDSWRLRYLVVATSNRAFEYKVLAPMDKIRDIEAASQEVRIDMTKESVADAESYDPAEPINIKFEPHWYDYLGRPVDL